MDRYTLHTFLMAAVSLVLFNTVNCQSGFRVTVSENMLNNINRIEVGEIQRVLNGQRFTEMSQHGDLEYRISNIRVTDVDAISSSLDLRSGNIVDWRADVSSITVHANWWVRLVEPMLKMEIFSGSGDLRVASQTITVYLRIALSARNGGLNIELASCSAQIRNLDMHFTGGLLADIINLIKEPIRDIIVVDVQNMVCDIIESVMTDLADDMKTINTRYDINVIGISLVLDNRFNDIKVDSNRITCYHKGAVRWNGKYFATRQSAQDLPVSRAALAVDLGEDTINNLMQAVTLAGVLNGQFSYTEIVNKKIGEFYLTCPDGVFLCAGTLLHDRVTNYLDGVLAMRWNVTDARLQVLPGKIQGTLRGHVNFTAQTENAESELFGATMDATVPFQAKMSQQGLALRPACVGGSLTIDSSRIGKILSQDLQTLINIKGFMSGIQSRISQMFQDFPNDYPINLPRDLHFRRSSVAFYQGVIRVEGDVCYKQHCTYEENDSWEGDLGTESFKILDILPTTTTSKTTTTTTKTTTAVDKSIASTLSLKTGVTEKELDINSTTTIKQMSSEIINANRSTSNKQTGVTDKNSYRSAAGHGNLGLVAEIWILITILSLSNMLFLP